MSKLYNVTEPEAVKSRWKSFWRHEYIGRPYVCLKATKDGCSRHSYDGSYVRRIRAARAGDMRSYLLDCDAHARSTVHYGESLPNYSMDISPDQHAMFFGGRVECRDGQYTNWVKPIADELSELDLTFDRNCEAVRTLEGALRAAADFADGRFLVHVPDYHSNLDTLSALLSPQNLCYELIDNPELLEEKLDQINSVYNEIYDIFYRAGRMEENGALGWLPLYCEGRVAVIQCDFSCMISPRDAVKYLIPSLERELDSLDHSVYHYDGSGALGHFEDVMAIKRLDCLQWKPDPGEKTYDRMHLLLRAQELGKSVWLYDWSPEEILADDRLDPALTVFSLSVKSEAEAEDFMLRLEKKYHA